MLMTPRESIQSLRAHIWAAKEWRNPETRYFLSSFEQNKKQRISVNLFFRSFAEDGKKINLIMFRDSELSELLPEKRLGGLWTAGGEKKVNF